MIDLHTHSTASDGKLTPTELLATANKLGIKVLALTDHDTLSGLVEAAAEAEKYNIEFIPGIEISAENDPGTMHILGYYIDINHVSFNKKLEKLRIARGRRNHRILEKLDELGYPLQWDEVSSLAKGESMGRPHIATAMITRGYVSSFNAAFDDFLGKGAPAYVGRDRMTAEDAVSSIHEAGGLAVLAHPQTLGLERDQLANLINELASYGLDGVEVYYYSHSEEEIALYKSLAEANRLLLTGGTDFHGPGMVETDLGVGKGDMKVPPEVVQLLREAHESRTSVDI
jgi:predicted metal-dependent phosphoesterase TrpH